MAHKSDCRCAWREEGAGLQAARHMIGLGTSVIPLYRREKAGRTPNLHQGMITLVLAILSSRILKASPVIQLCM